MLLKTNTISEFLNFLKYVKAIDNLISKLVFKILFFMGNDADEAIRILRKFYLLMVFSSNLAYRCFRQALILRRYEDANWFHKFINPQTLLPTPEQFFATEIVAKSIASIIQKPICRQYKSNEFLLGSSSPYEPVIDIAKKELSCKSPRFFTRENIPSIILEYFTLDCMWCEDHKNLFKLHQQLEFSDENSDENFHHVTLSPFWVSSVGHFYYFDSFVKGVLLGLIPIKTISVNFEEGDISNKFIFSRYLNILDKHNVLHESSESLNENKRIPILYPWLWPHKDHALVNATDFSETIQKEWIVSGQENFKIAPPLLVEKLAETLGSKGINIKKTITFHIRQPGFKAENSKSTLSPRNSDPKTFFNALLALKAANFFEKNKFTFLMMGDRTMQAVPDSLRDLVFDYAHSDLKSEEFDAFLVQEAAAHIGTVSGVSHLPCLFGKPTLFINCYPLFRMIKTQATFLPKIFRSCNGNFMSYREVAKVKPPVYFSGSLPLRNQGLVLQDNSSEEIAKALKNFIVSLETFPWEPNGVDVDIYSGLEDETYDPTYNIDKDFFEAYKSLFL